MFRQEENTTSSFMIPPYTERFQPLRDQPKLNGVEHPLPPGSGRQHALRVSRAAKGEPAGAQVRPRPNRTFRQHRIADKSIFVIQTAVISGYRCRRLAGLAYFSYAGRKTALVGHWAASPA